MASVMHRRTFLELSALCVADVSLKNMTNKSLEGSPKDPLFRISLAQWSLHKTLFDKKLDNLDFARTAKNDFGIEAVEYVNQFFKDKAQDQQYLAELKKRCTDLGVESRLIMIDDEGDLGDPDAAKRTQAVENHYKWADAGGNIFARSSATAASRAVDQKRSWPAGSARVSPARIAATTARQKASSQNAS